MSALFAKPHRAVILTAIGVEYKAVRPHLTNLHEKVHAQGNVYEQGSFSANGKIWEVLLGQTVAGNPNAAFETERAINFFQPSVVLFVGVAGGRKDVKPGDVVAGSKVYGYESGKAGPTFLSRLEFGRSSYRLEKRAEAEARKGNWLHRIRDQKPTTQPIAYVGPIAAGEQVIASTQSQIARFLARHCSDSLAIEMEGYGFLQAVHGNAQVEALVIRGISDLLDGKSEADAKGSQEIAARHAAAFAFEILAHLYVENKDNSALNSVTTEVDHVTNWREHAQQGQQALFHADYQTAQYHLKEASILVPVAQFPVEAAQIKFWLSLVCFKGERPRKVSIKTMEVVEQYLQTAIRLSPLYSYHYTLGLIKLDFAPHHLPQYTKQEALKWKRKADKLSKTPQDEENLRLLSQCQRLLCRNTKWPTA